MKLLKVMCYVTCGILTFTAFGCKPNVKEYVTYFTHPNNGLRQQIVSKHSQLTIQYISSELKALTEHENAEKMKFEERVKELDDYILFELEIENKHAEIEEYLKSALEYDISLKAGNRLQYPVFYHLEYNPMKKNYKIQVYFQRKQPPSDYSLAIASSKWFDHIKVNVKQQDIKNSPHLNL